MKLTKEHRQEFIAALEKAQKEAESYRRMIEKSVRMFEWDAYLYLANKRIELIKQTLIDNEIDY